MLHDDNLLELILGRTVPLNLALVCKKWRDDRTVLTRTREICCLGGTEIFSWLLEQSSSDRDSLRCVVSGFASTASPAQAASLVQIFSKADRSALLRGIMVANRRDILENLGCWASQLLRDGESADEALNHGIRAGSLDALDWLSPFLHDRGVIFLSACPRDVATLNWALDTLRIFDHTLYPLAVEEGKLDVLEALWSSGVRWLGDSTVLFAKAAERPDVVAWLRSKFRPYAMDGYHLRQLLAAVDDVERARAIVRVLCKVDRDDDALIGARNAAQARMLREEGYSWPPTYTFHLSRDPVDDELLDYAAAEGCEWSGDTLDARCRFTFDQVVKAVSRGCPWARDSLRMQCLQTEGAATWALDHGCPSPRVFDVLRVPEDTLAVLIGRGAVEIDQDGFHLLMHSRRWVAARAALEINHGNFRAGMCRTLLESHCFTFLRWAMQTGSEWDDAIDPLLSPVMRDWLRGGPDAGCLDVDALRRLDRSSSQRPSPAEMRSLAREGVSYARALFLVPTEKIASEYAAESALGAVAADRADFLSALLEDCPALLRRSGNLLLAESVHRSAQGCAELLLGQVVPQHAGHCPSFEACPSESMIRWVLSRRTRTAFWGELLAEAVGCALRHGRLDVLSHVGAQDLLWLESCFAPRVWYSAGASEASLEWLSEKLPADGLRALSSDALMARPLLVRFIAARTDVSGRGDDLFMCADTEDDLRFLRTQLGLAWPASGISDRLAGTPLLKTAVSLGCPWDESTTATIWRKTGNADEVLWAVERGCPWSPRTLEATHRWWPDDGQLVRLLERGCPVCRSAASFFVKEGALWALIAAQRVEWDESLSLMAARRGRVSVLTWARSAGLAVHQAASALLV